MKNTNLTPREFILTSLKSLRNNWDDYFCRPLTEADMVILVAEIRVLDAWIAQLEETNAIE